MKRPRGGSTPKQYAYAQLKMTGGGRSKKEIGKLAGFSNSVAANAKYKIENTEGFHNAMLELATKSNNILLSILSEYQARGLKDFSNKDLNGAVNAIGAAWDRIENRRNPAKSKDPEQNPLRRAILQKVENQTINVNPANPTPIEAEDRTPDFVKNKIRTVEVKEEDPNDF